MTGLGLCRCETPDRAISAEGREYCESCGDPLATATDRLLAAVVRGQRQIIDQQGSILERLEALEAAPPPTTNGTAGPELLDVAEMAKRIGRKPHWIRDNAAALGAIRLGDGPRGRLLFDPEIVRERLAERSVQPMARSEANGSQPTKAKPRRRSPSSAELLPIRGGRS